MTTAFHRQIVIACAADGRYALPLTVMLRSVVTNLDPLYQLDVYAVDDGIAAADKEKIRASLPERVALHWIEARTSAFRGIPLWGRMPVTTYQKLTVGEWLPAGVEKAIWLDCDLLVLEDLAHLWNMDLCGSSSLAAVDQRVPAVSSTCGIAAYRELGLTADAKYFNAGVMLINVSRWRADDVSGKSIEYLKKHRDRVFFWDQEALNVALAGTWIELAPRWNRHPGLDYLGGANAGQPASLAAIPSDEGTGILHFSGNLKPWESTGSGPYRQLYTQYLNDTAWAGWRPANTWRSRMLAAYEASRARRFLYPAEQWATRVVRACTRTYQA